jgi:hypothetical protein
VVGRRFAAERFVADCFPFDFFAADPDFAADPAREPDVLVAPGSPRLSEGTAPVDTRDECFGR